MLGNRSLGFIGAGMMAEAIIRGLLAADLSPEKIRVYDPDHKRLEFFNSEFGIGAGLSNRDVALSSDIIIIAVKPYLCGHVVGEISDALNTDRLMLSIAAGVSIEDIDRVAPSETPIIRVMPNAPALIGKAATAIAPGKYAQAKHLDLAEEIFSAVGNVVRVTEDKINAVTGLSGSGPAYVYTFIEALADGGVRMGLPRATAVQLAAQTVLGSAEMVLQTGSHTGELRDRVTTPGGTTIEGLVALESAGFRAGVIDAVTSAALRSEELGKK